MNPTWNHEAIDQMFREMSGGFAPASLPEIILFAALILLLVLAAVIPYFYFQKKSRQNRRLLADSSFSRHVREQNLLPAESNLLKALAVRLPSPEISKHLLLQRREIFEHCAELLEQEKPGYRMELLALRIRLGFAGHPLGGILRTTADLPIGVCLESEGGIPLFRIVEIRPALLMADLLLPALRSGRTMNVIVRRPEGKYLFQTSLLRRYAGELVGLSHSPFVHRIQVRRHYRYPVALPVRLGSVESHSVNISGGGACLRLPDRLRARMHAGKIYPLHLELPGARSIEGRARIVRDDESEFVHIHFADLREGTRDRLIHHLRDEERKRERVPI